MIDYIFGMPYEPIHSETDLDKTLRLYTEADEFYTKLTKDINDSNMDGLTKVICLFNVKTQWLERKLNDFYDRIAITSSVTNPYVVNKEASNRIMNNFKRKEETARFADLTLGTKLTALKLFNYIDKTSEEKYQDYLQQLENFIKNRNQIIHNLFTQNLETKEKIRTVTKELIRLEILLIATEQRDSTLTKYLAENMSKHWNLNCVKKNEEER